MTSKLGITSLTVQGRVPITIFQLKGEVDVYTYEQLVDLAEDAVDNGTRNILLDLSDVDYIASAGLRAIHQIYTLLRDRCADEESDEAVRRGLLDGTYKSPHLKLLNPSPVVEKVLKMGGFDMYLESYKDIDAAVASF